MAITNIEKKLDMIEKKVIDLERRLEREVKWKEIQIEKNADRQIDIYLFVTLTKLIQFVESVHTHVLAQNTA